MRIRIQDLDLDLPTVLKIEKLNKKVLILTGCGSATSYWIWAWIETLIWSGILISCGDACLPRPPPTPAPGGPAPACPASRRLPLLPGPGRLAAAYRPSSRRGRLARAGDDLDLCRF